MATDTLVKQSLVYEGKAKKIWTTEYPELYISEFKDDLTAFNGEKKSSEEGKGALNNEISTELFKYLNEKGIPTHFVEMLDPNHMLHKKAEVIYLVKDTSELDYIRYMARRINTILTEFYAELNIKVVDFKLEFGRDHNGNIILIDELSPDNFRLWDSETDEKLDKDRFRQGLGGLTEAYKMVLDRIKNR
jgi:phosphoribosylaminoimidazole-succinocarboxamide synthase